MRQETNGREAVRPRFLRVLRQILGAPDYAAYLEHCKRAGHQPPRSEREYLSDFFERKGRVVRCC